MVRNTNITVCPFKECTQLLIFTMDKPRSWPSYCSAGACLHLKLLFPAIFSVGIAKQSLPRYTIPNKGGWSSGGYRTRDRVQEEICIVDGEEIV